MVLMQEDKMIAGLVPEEGGGGHVIQDASGTAVAQEPTMQFTDSHVSDDSTNEKTVIENIKSVTEAQFESATEDGLYDVDVEGAEIGEISEDYVEVTADGVKTYGQLLNELYTSIDYSKITYNSKIQDNLYVYNISRYPSNSLVFTCTRKENEVAYRITVFQLSSSSTLDEYRNHTTAGMTATSYTDTVPTSGTVITLYYGNDKAVVDLQTTANRCVTSDGGTVQQALDNMFGIISVPIAGTVISNYYGTVSTGLDTSIYTAIGLYETNTWDENCNYTIGSKGAGIHIKCRLQSYTIPNETGALKVIYVKNSMFN